MQRLIIVLSLLMAGCATQAPPASNAYCRLYQRLPDPGDAVHLTKRENKVAILTNEETFQRECLQGDN